MPQIIDGVGPTIRSAYEARGLTRQQFAERVKLSPKTITNVTCPSGGVISRPAAVRIAEVLGWRPAQIVSDIPPDSSQANAA